VAFVPARDRQEIEVAKTAKRNHKTVNVTNNIFNSLVHIVVQYSVLFFMGINGYK